MGSAVMPDASVSTVTASAPSSDAARIRPGEASGFISGLKISG